MLEDGGAGGASRRAAMRARSWSYSASVITGWGAAYAMEVPSSLTVTITVNEEGTSMAYAAPQSVITLAEYDQLRALIAAHIDAHRAHARASIDLAMDESQAEIIWDRLRATADELVWYLTDLLSQEDQRRLRERQSGHYRQVRR